MKNWTRRFIHRRPNNTVCSYEENAERAKKSKLKIPPKLFIQISKAVRYSELTEGIRENDTDESTKFNTMFAAGFACGWAEKSNSVK